MVSLPSNIQDLLGEILVVLAIFSATLVLMCMAGGFISLDAEKAAVQLGFLRLIAMTKPNFTLFGFRTGGNRKILLNNLKLEN